MIYGIGQRVEDASDHPDVKTTKADISRHSWPFYVALVAVVLANVVWVVTQRRGQPLDIDEAGYAGIAMNDFLGLHSGGVATWWHAIVNQPVQAPLAPALASVVDWMTGARILNIFFVSLFAYAMLLFTTLGLTRDWSMRRRVFALFFVAASPVLLNYSRSFNFAELAAACLAGALYFGSRSQNFGRFGPAVAWGACLGLMVLSRTMTVAFVPGLVLAAVVPVLARWSLRRFLRVLSGLAAATAVAATWYVHNFGSVYAYLTSFGYGSRAVTYGPARSLWSVHAWYVFFLDMTDGYLHAGLAAFLLIGWLAGGLFIAKWIRSFHLTGGGFPQFVGLARAKLAHAGVVFSCALVATAGTAALMSTRNQGSAFIAPLIVPLVLVATWSTGELIQWVGPRTHRLVAGVVASAGVVVVGFTLVSAVLTLLPIPVVVVASVPVPGSALVTLWDSRGTLRLYEDGGQIPTSIEPNPGSRATGRAWLSASTFVDTMIRKIANRESRPSMAVFAFNSRMVNVNTVELDSLMRHGSPLAIYLMVPIIGKASTHSYLQQVAPFDAQVTAVVTVTSAADQFVPYVPVQVGIDYAKSLHFSERARYKLPDGQWLVVWGRQSPLTGPTH